MREAEGGSRPVQSGEEERGGVFLTVGEKKYVKEPQGDTNMPSESVIRTVRDIQPDEP